MATWAFQADPSRFNALRAAFDLDEMTWRVTRYADEIRVGDQVVLWLAGANAGAYALAEIVSDVRQDEIDTATAAYVIAEFEESGTPTATVRMKITKRFLTCPLLRAVALNDALLSQMLILRQPAGTNFPVTNEEFTRIEQLLCAEPGRWTREELILVLALHRGVADGAYDESSVRSALGRLIGRTEGSIDWVLLGFGALDGIATDPESVKPSRSQHEVWEEFATRTEALRASAKEIEANLLRGGGLATAVSVAPDECRVVPNDQIPAADASSVGSQKHPALPSSRRRAALEALSARCLRDLVDELRLEVDDYRVREQLIGSLADGRRHDFGIVLNLLTRDELKQVCGALRLDEGGKEKAGLVERILASGNGELPATELADQGALSAGQKRELLTLLKATRLRELVDQFKLEAESYRDRATLIAALADGRKLPFGAVLNELTRDELKEMCSAFGLEDGAKDKGALVARLLAGPVTRSDESTRTTNGDGSAARATVPSARKRGLLNTLKADRLRDLVRQFRLEAASYRDRDDLINALADGRRLDFRVVLNELTREELKDMGATLGLPKSSQDKHELVERLLLHESRERPAPRDDRDEDEPTATDGSAVEKLARCVGGILKIEDVNRGWPAAGSLMFSIGSLPVSIYVRRIGGSSRNRAWERRFQNPAAKGIRMIRQPQDGVRPLLLGLWDEQGDERAVLVAMDPYRRLNQDTRVSLFMPLALLELAADTGEAQHRSGSGEIIYALRLRDLPAKVDWLLLHHEARLGEGAESLPNDNSASRSAANTRGAKPYDADTDVDVEQRIADLASEPIRYSDGSTRFACKVSCSDAGAREPWLRIEWDDPSRVYLGEINTQNAFVRKHLNKETAGMFVELAVSTIYGEYKARTMLGDNAGLVRQFTEDFLRYMAIRDGDSDDADDD